MTIELPGLTDLALIGRGGFSRVYSALETQFSRRVAVKVFDVDLVNPADQRSFTRECAMTGALGSHPHIVSVFSAGIANGTPYIVMEHMDRGSLQDRLRDAGARPVPEALARLIEVASAAHRAHLQSITHRDIKPANILVSGYDQVALADFGIAALVDVATRTSPVDAFSPQHAAPEVINGETPHLSGDIYSLCSTLHHLLAAQPPFVRRSGEGLALYLRRVITDPPDPLPPSVPAPLVELIDRGMSKDPGSRFESADELVHALWSVQSALGYERTPAPGIDAPGPGSRTSSAARPDVVRARATFAVDLLERGGTARTRLAVKRHCAVCRGTGRRDGRSCDPCEGSGRIASVETFDFEIPAGHRSGDVIRLAGRGNDTADGTARGDILLTVLANAVARDLSDPLLTEARELLPDDDVVVATPTATARRVAIVTTKRLVIAKRQRGSVGALREVSSVPLQQFQPTQGSDAVDAPFTLVVGAQSVRCHPEQGRVIRDALEAVAARSQPATDPVATAETPSPPVEPEPPGLPPASSLGAWDSWGETMQRHDEAASPRRPVTGPELAVGIDLGTTNSAVAIVRDGTPEIVANREGGRTTPSVVGFASNGQTLVGEVARRQTISNPDRTIRSAKRHLGTTWAVDIDGKSYAGQEIAARTLIKIKRDAEARLGGTITQAVITAPGSSDPAVRIAIKEAANVAGIEVLRILGDATAAALAYGFRLRPDQDQTILVFDLGGGTFDVSVLEVGDGVFEVKSNQGDPDLGGDDWDRRIVDHLLDRFLKETGVDLRGDVIALQRLLDAAEAAKVALSQTRAERLHLPFIAGTDAGPLHLDVELTRDDLERLTVDLVDRCRGPFERAVAAAGLAVTDLDEVVLVGGSTRMPAVRDLVRSLTHREPNHGVNPDEVVAMGAAVQAAMLKGRIHNLLLLDITPLSVGVETTGGASITLIPANSIIPTRRTVEFTTDQDYQPSVEIHFVQGEHARAQDNRTLGTLQLVGLPPERRASRRIDVTIDVDANGIVNVAAKDRSSGIEQSMTVVSPSSLSKDQIGRMIKEADAQAETVIRRREAAERPGAPAPTHFPAPPDVDARTGAPSEATVAAILAVLPAMDVCDLARSVGDDELADTRDELVRVLDRLGAERIDRAGVAFDPSIHEAVSHDADPGMTVPTVISVVRAGYRCGDRLIRPALVGVRG